MGNGVRLGGAGRGRRARRGWTLARRIGTWGCSGGRVEVTEWLRLYR